MRFSLTSNQREPRRRTKNALSPSPRRPLHSHAPPRLAKIAQAFDSGWHLEAARDQKSVLSLFKTGANLAAKLAQLELLRHFVPDREMTVAATFKMCPRQKIRELIDIARHFFCQLTCAANYPSELAKTWSEF